MSEVRLLTGDCRELLPTLEVGSVAAVVTDPPYELGFMGKRWDRSGVGIQFFHSVEPLARQLWDSLDDAQRAALAAVLSALGGDLFWLYGSGFPKHRSKLKPAYEPICVARKGGVSPLNIDDGRIGAGTHVPGGGGLRGGAETRHPGYVRPSHVNGSATAPHDLGRWPANVALDEEAAAMLDEQSGNIKGAVSNGKRAGTGYGAGFGEMSQSASYGDTGGASRFFYVAKATRAERERGLEKLPAVRARTGLGGEMPIDDTGRDRDRFEIVARNHHPTVKPIELMRWLVRLASKPGETILDPFAGSGTTGIAAVEEGRNFVGIELDPNYVEIARRRIGAAPLSLFSEGA